jgi:hypothetical protein
LAWAGPLATSTCALATAALAAMMNAMIPDFMKWLLTRK